MRQDRQRLLGATDEEEDDLAATSGSQPLNNTRGQEDTVSLDIKLAIAFLVLGAGMLWPFNSFITANEFFSKIFAGNATLLAYYSPSITFLFTLTNLMSTMYCTKSVQTANLDFRIRSSTLLTSILLVILAVLTAVELSDTLYFVVLMIIVALTGVSTGFLQNGVFGIIGFYDSRYVQYVMIGQGVAGLTPAILSILVATLSGDPGKTATSRAVAYFSSSALVVALSFAAHMYLQSGSNAGITTLEAHDTTNPIMTKDMQRYRQFLHRFHPWTIFLVFAVTLSVFPSITASIVSVSSTRGNDTLTEAPRFLQPQVFIPLGFLCWNGGDLIARVFSAIPFLVVESPTILFLLSLARMSFIPVVYLCNVRGEGAIIKSDIFFFAYMVSFGLTNGYLGSLTMAAAIKQARPMEKKDTGAFMSFMLCLGLVVGSLVAFVF